jgi:hypothetical protein
MCRARGQRYNPPNNATNSGATTINKAAGGSVGECPVGLPFETCRARGLRPNNTNNSGATVGTKK